jgi:hypothetical protein
VNIFMEISQETPCVAILNKQKHHFFSLPENQRTGRWNRSCLGGGVGTSGRGAEVGKW